MDRIDFQLDWYGSTARYSALCDYLELLASRGTHVSEDDLADIIDDSDWRRYLYSQFSGTGSVIPEDSSKLSDIQDESRELARVAVAVLEQRAELLKSSYPFRVGQGRYVLAAHKATRYSPYWSLLAISIVHASSSSSVQLQSVRTLFERVVSETLAARGVPTARLSEYGLTFKDRVESACEKVGLDVSVGSASHVSAARDHGTDTISNLWPDDDRLGGIQLVGQATCAKTHYWEAKLNEPKVGLWQRWLGTNMAPIRFLAVPHHVQPDFWIHLQEAHTRFDLVDRMRLSMIDRVLLVAETKVIDAVRGATIEALS